MFFLPSFSGDQNDPVKSSGAMPLNLQPAPATTNHTPMDINPASKPELLPANLVDLTVRRKKMPIWQERFKKCLRFDYEFWEHRLLSLYLHHFSCLRCQSCGSSCVSVASPSLAPSLLCCSVFVPSSFNMLALALLPFVSWVPAWSPSFPAPQCYPVRALAQAPATDWIHPAAAPTNSCTSKMGEFLMGFSVTLQTEFQMELYKPSQMYSQMLRQSVWQVNSVVSPALCSWLLPAPPQELQVRVYPCRLPHHCSVGLPGELRVSSSSNSDKSWVWSCRWGRG